MTDNKLTGESNELKPCPFCGGEAELYHAICRTPDPDGTLQGHCVTDCTTCNANVEFETSEQDAIRVWNTRPIEEALKAENERLREALQKIADSKKLTYFEKSQQPFNHEIAKQALGGE